MMQLRYYKYCACTN